MILSAIISVVAIILIFLVGFLTTKILFDKLDFLETLTHSLIFGISYLVIIGIILGFNETFKTITGGLTKFNLWAYTIAIDLILVAIYFFRKRQAKKKQAHK